MEQTKSPDPINASLSRDEEVKIQIIDWEERNGKKLNDLSRREWIDAISVIMCLTKYEAEEYLDYLTNRL